MRATILGLTILIAMTAVTLPAPATESAADSIAIAIVDVNGVVERSKYKAQYDREFEIFVEAKKTELEKRKSEVEAKLKALEQEMRVLSEESRQEARHEAAIETQRYQEYARQLQVEIGTRENEYRKLLSDKVREVIQQVAEEQHINLVLNSLAVICKDQVLDLSDLVLERFDEAYEQEKAGGSSAEEAPTESSADADPSE